MGRNWNIASYTWVFNLPGGLVRQVATEHKAIFRFIVSRFYKHFLGLHFP